MASGLRILVPVKRVIDYAVWTSPSKRATRDGCRHEDAVTDCTGPKYSPNNSTLTLGILFAMYRSSPASTRPRQALRPPASSTH